MLLLWSWSLPGIREMALLLLLGTGLPLVLHLFFDPDPEDSTRLPPGEGSSAPSEPAKPLSDELPPGEGSSAPSEPAKPLSDELPPGEGSSAPSEPAKPLSDEELRQKRLLHLGE